MTLKGHPYGYYRKLRESNEIKYGFDTFRKRVINYGLEQTLKMPLPKRGGNYRKFEGQFTKIV